jgi:hypothetical protein
MFLADDLRERRRAVLAVEGERHAATLSRHDGGETRATVPGT